MRDQHRQTPPSEEAKLPGIIDTIGDAFALLNHRPYLIWLPIVLDLYLWLGVRLSPRPLTDAIERWLSTLEVSDPGTLDLIHSLGEQFNLFELLSVATPSLLGDLGRNAVASAGGQGWITNLPWWLVPPIGLALIIMGIAVGVGYLTMIAYLVSAQPVSLRQYLREFGRNAVRMLGLIVVAALLVALIALPLVMISGLFAILGVNITPLVAFILLVGVIWGFFLLFFAQDAIVISHVGPMRAIYLSYNLVRRHFWPAVGFISVSMLIRSGTPLALHLFTGSPWSVPFALIGHAYIATGLVAAAMLFYRDRVRTLGGGQQGAPSLDQGTS